MDRYLLPLSERLGVTIGTAATVGLNTAHPDRDHPAFPGSSGNEVQRCAGMTLARVSCR
jgi:hypothetical protein